MVIRNELEIAVGLSSFAPGLTYSLYVPALKLLGATIAFVVA